MEPETLTVAQVRAGIAKAKALGIALYKHAGKRGMVVPDTDGTRYPHFAGHAELIELPQAVGPGVVVGIGGKGWFFEEAAEQFEREGRLTFEIQPDGTRQTVRYLRPEDRN